MIKKIIALAAAGILALSLSACGGPVEKLPALTLPGDTSSSASSTVSGTSGVSGTETSSMPPKEVKADEFDDTLEGLCQYLEKNYAVTGDKTEMSYKEIGAIGGFRYKFTLNNSTVQAEFYEFDLANLDEKGQECLDNVKKDGKFTVLGNQVPATLSSTGKYLMIYTDSSKDEINNTQREKVTKLFTGFKA